MEEEDRGSRWESNLEIIFKVTSPAWEGVGKREFPVSESRAQPDENRGFLWRSAATTAGGKVTLK